MNKEMLLRVAKRLRSIKDREFDQSTWVTTVGSPGSRYILLCIAGWTCVEAGYALDGPTLSAVDPETGKVVGAISVVAAEALGISPERILDGQPLFGAGGERWPEEYRDRLMAATRAESLRRFGTPQADAESPRIIAAELLEALAAGTVSMPEDI